LRDFRGGRKIINSVLATLRESIGPEPFNQLLKFLVKSFLYRFRVLVSEQKVSVISKVMDKALLKCFVHIIDVNSKEKRSKNRSLWNSTGDL
jgi:hypothetical protein